MKMAGQKLNDRKQGTCFSFTAESSSMFNGSCSERQTAAFPQAVLKYRFKLGTQAYDSENKQQRRTKI